MKKGGWLPVMSIIGLLLVGVLLLQVSHAPVGAWLGSASPAATGACTNCNIAAAASGPRVQDDGSRAIPPGQLATTGGTSPASLMNSAEQAAPWIGIFVSAALSLALLRMRGGSRLRRTFVRLAPVLVIFLLLVSAFSLGRSPSTNVVAATPAAPATELVTYQSDFGHGYTTGWFVQPGTNSLATVGIVQDNGTKVLAASAHRAESAIVFYNAGEDWQNQTVTATFKGINGTQFDLIFRDQLIVASDSNYDVNIDLNAQAVRLQRTQAVGANAVTTVLSTVNFAFSLNTWYTIGVNATGGSLQVSFNGVRIISAVDPSPFVFGTIAFNARDVYGAFHVGSVSVTARVPAQSSWQQLGGPDGGQIQALAINPTNTSIVYAGAVHTGVLKSDNRGDYWKEIGFSNGMTGTKANVVVIVPSNSSIIYASLEDSSTGGGAYRSDDGGLHWRPLSQGLTGYFVDAMAVDPTNPNLLYFATENLVGSSLPVGLQKSLDGGSTSATVLSAQVDAISVSRSNPNTIYVGTLDKGLLRSDDAGASWRNLTPANAPGVPFNRVVIDPQNPNIALAHQGVVNLGGRTCGPILRTTDGGLTWAFINGGMPYFGNNPCSPFGGLTDVSQSLSNPSTLYAVANYPNGTGVYLRSDDSGADWRMLNGKMSAPPEVVTIDPNDPNVAFIGTFGEGVYRTLDGGASLVHLTTGSPAGGVYSLAVYPGNSNVIFASRSINGYGEYADGLGRLSKSTDGGITWTDSNGPPYNIVDIQIDPTNPSTMYVATSGSPLATGTGIWKSTDGGATWVQKNQGLTYPNLTRIAISPSNSNVLLAGTGHWPYGGTAGDGIFKSTDGGNSWHKVNIPNLDINRLVFNPINANITYASTSGGGVYKSTDAGENWSQANDGIGNVYVNALAINPAQPDTLYAGVNPFYANPSLPETTNSVFKTTNGGANWNLVFLDQDVEWILLDPGNPQNVYEGNHGGYISYSLDGGSTWTYGSEVVRKLGGHAYMWAATTDPGRRALLIGTCGRGVFINRLTTAEVPTPVWLKIPSSQAYYSSTFLSNASLVDFRFNQVTKSFAFTVTGTAGSRALANVSIPTNLLSGPYSLTLDGSIVSPLSTTNLPSKNVTQILLAYTQNGKTQQLAIQGSLTSTTTTTTTTSKTTAVTTSSSTATSTPTSTSTSSSSSAISSSTSSSSSTSFTTTSTTSTASFTQSSSASSTSHSTSPSSVSSSETTSSSGGGIPEFPFQLLAVSVVSALIVASYLLVRVRHFGPTRF